MPEHVGEVKLSPQEQLEQRIAFLEKGACDVYRLIKSHDYVAAQHKLLAIGALP